MKKILFFYFVFVLSLFGQSFIKPDFSFQASGGVVDMVFKDTKLYVATDSSRVDIFDLTKHKPIQTIKIDKITDFMGDKVNAKVFSVDILKKRMLILSQAERGFRRVYIYEEGKLEIVVPVSMSLSIAKAKFLDADTILLALLGDELISYNIKSKKINWRVQVSGSKFSNFALDEMKQKVVVADESGDLQIINTKDGSHVKSLSGQNVDNVFQVDYKNGIIASAGQDRRAVIYDLKSHTAYYKKSHFLVYSIGLSPSGKLAAYSSDEHNSVRVFKTDTKSVLGDFGGNKMTLTKILFLNEQTFLTSSDDSVINLYHIK